MTFQKETLEILVPVFLVVRGFLFLFFFFLLAFLLISFSVKKKREIKKLRDAALRRLTTLICVEFFEGKQTLSLLLREKVFAIYEHGIAAREINENQKEINKFLNLLACRVSEIQKNEEEAKEIIKSLFASSQMVVTWDEAIFFESSCKQFRETTEEVEKLFLDFQKRFKELGFQVLKERKTYECLVVQN